MAQAAYYYAAGETQRAEAKMLEVKKRTEEATAELRELQYWTEIANTIIKLAKVEHVMNATHSKEREKYEKILWGNWNKYLTKWKPYFNSKSLQF